jgi:hypothetical protein
MNKPTQVISFRLGDEELKALQSHQQPKESLNQAAQRLLKTALGFDPPKTSVDPMFTNVDELKTEMSAYLESLVNKRFAQIRDSSPQPDNSALADLQSKIEHLSKVLVVNIPTTGELDGLRERIDHALLTISAYSDRLATLEAKQDAQTLQAEVVLQSSPEPIIEEAITETNISPELFEATIPAADSLDKEETASPKSRRTYARKRSTVNGDSASQPEASPLLTETLPEREAPPTPTQQLESLAIPMPNSLDQEEIVKAASPKSRRSSVSKRDARTEKKQELESLTIPVADSLDEIETTEAPLPKSRRTSVSKRDAARVEKKPELESPTISAADSLDEIETTEAASPKSRRTSASKRDTARVEKKQELESPTIPAADSLNETETTEAASPKSRRSSASKQDTTGSVASRKGTEKKRSESPAIPTLDSLDQEKIAKARGQIMEELKVGTQSPKYKAVAKALDIFTKQLSEQDLTRDSDLEGIRSTVLKSLTTGRKSSKLAPNSPEYKAVTKAIDDFISITKASS